MKKYFIYTLIFIMFSCVKTHTKIKVKEYPKTAKKEVTDSYFGKKVTDPYRWLEDDLSNETSKWVKAQIR